MHKIRALVAVSSLSFFAACSNSEGENAGDQSSSAPVIQSDPSPSEADPEAGAGASGGSVETGTASTPVPSPSQPAPSTGAN